MIESTLFKGISFLSSQGQVQQDVLVKDGKIVLIEPSIKEHAEQIINEPGLLLMPGVIDPHVHFRDPGATHKEDLYSGPKAAAAGGVTSFFEMPNTKPSTTTAALMDDKKKLASQKSLINYNFFIGATEDNIDELLNVENVAGIKIYVGSSTGSLLVDDSESLQRIFEKANKLIAVHSEDEATIKRNLETYRGSSDVHDHLNIRSTEAALICTKRLLELAKRTQSRLHICHLTSKDELDLINDYALKNVTTEVSPQHLLLNAPDCYESLGTLSQINPPIRERYHTDALINGLKNEQISLIATDHAPHTLDEKLKQFPNAPSGMPGIETSLPLLLTLVNKGRFSLEQVIKWMCEGPVACFNIQNKGYIKVGYDADLVLIDLKKKHQLSNKKTLSKAGWTAFDGWNCEGSSVATFVNGQMVFRENDFFEDIKGKEIFVGLQR
ncbi:dihydroorotase [Candidatus Marinamargulisbacteria bacterium SCGC AAA071-K20]|nr:dihydroorotase [Candidatus Marinamargulisbacteria bacterium SCGC AAA071-K20]